MSNQNIILEIKENQIKSTDENKIHHEVLYPIFTRYLYITTDVYNTLYRCLGIAPFAFSKNTTIDREQVYFWTFELYCSGFEKEMIEWFEWILEIHKTVLLKVGIQMREIKKQISLVEEMKNKIINTKSFEIKNQIKHEEHEEHEKHILLATILEGILYFMTCIHKQQCAPHIFHIKIHDEDIDCYININNAPPSNKKSRPYQILANNCLWKTDKTHVDELPIDRMTLYNSMVKNENNQWLYYCSFTPIWKKRILQHNGTIEDNLCQIIFEKEEDEDEFFSKYGYEPDNDLSIVERCIGI